MNADAPKKAVDVVDLLFQAAFGRRQSASRRHAFLFGPPGTPSALFRMGTEVFYSDVALAKTALVLREVGALYLRSLPIDEIEGELTGFLAKAYWLLAKHVWRQSFDGSYSTRVPAAVRDEFATLLAASQLFSPLDFVTVYPLVPIVIKSNFQSGPFFLVSANSLSTVFVGAADVLVPSQFPPLPNWKGRIERPQSWLGVRSPSETSAKRIRNVVLGATALLPHPLERHRFSGRPMFGGTASFRGSTGFSFGKPCTPALSEDIAIDGADVPWLEVLASKLLDSSLVVRRQMRALEYFYRAWPLPEAERFPVLFMALDAVFGDASQHTQAVVDAIGVNIGAGYDVKRLKLLMKLRAAVIHGDDAARLDDPVDRAPVDDEVLDHRERAGPPRLDGDRVAVPEAPHVQLACGGPLLRPVGDAVDHHPAGAADALPTVVIEGDRGLPLLDQAVIHHIQHLEEGGVGADVPGVVVHEPPGRDRSRLAPDAKPEVHL